MVNEFEFINNIKTIYSLDKVGDDCAILPKDANTDLLLTADMLIEDVDFRLAWTTPEFLGHKALAVSLSDIAAMGGEPEWAMLSIGIPERLWKTEFLDKFYAGWFELAKKFHVELVGGDISRTPDKLVIDSIVGGDVGKGRAILRSTAKAGDAIFASGTLGGAAGGLYFLENSFGKEKGSGYQFEKLIEKQLKPRPQITLAKLLQYNGLCSAMIDLSDGLSSDLGHLCQQSGVGAIIYAEKIPVDKDLYTLFPLDKVLRMVLNGGEDFELLFTVDKKNISQLTGLNVTQIGEVTSNVGIIELRTDDKIAILPPDGYRHF